MKKLILLLIPLFICGCSDFKELDSLAIIDAIGINYQNDEYIVTINTNNYDGKNEVFSESASSLAMAFKKCEKEIAKTPFYNHTKLIIINTNVISKFREVSDYLLRNTSLNNALVLLGTEDDPESILNEKKITKKIIGLTKNKDNSDTAKLIYLEDIIKNYYEKNSTTYLSVFKKDNDNITFPKIIVFNQDEVYEVSDISNFNILTNHIKNINYSKNDYSINITKGKTTYDISKNKVKISITLNATLLNSSDTNLRKNNNIKKLNKKVSTDLNNDLQKFLKELVDTELDPLGITIKYYQNTGKSIDLEKLTYEINTNVTINNIGEIYEVKDE